MEQFVIVAGNTGNGLVGLKFLQKLQRKGHTVFAITGNHEHYGNVSQGRTYWETEDAFEDGLGEHFSIHYLGEHRLAIIGANGWYRVDDEAHWQGYMNDSRCCGFSAEYVNMLAEGDAVWIEAELQSIPDGWRAIVVTHTSPSEQSLDPRYAGSAGNGYYFNPHMTPLLSRYADRIAVWNHGHTHCALDHVVDGVRIITNPRGYPGESPGWKPLTIEIENGNVRIP